MSEALMGPTYFLRFKWKEASVGRALLAGLGGEMFSLEGEFIDSLKESVWKCFTGHVHRYVKLHHFQHDGYSFEWDVSSLSYDPKYAPSEASASIGINVMIKDDDFEFFEELLNSTAFSSEVTDGIKSILLDRLSSLNLPLEKVVITVEESEFGYG